MTGVPGRRVGLSPAAHECIISNPSSQRPSAAGQSRPSSIRASYRGSHMGLTRSLGLALLSLAPLATAPAQIVQQNAASTDVNRGLPLAPARAARFTTSEGTWMSVDVSPDGRTLVFDMLGDLYSLPISGGAATRLTSGIGHDMHPRFSPDGKLIAFVSDKSGDNNLWVANADGSNQRQISKGIGDDFRTPEWTPDGQYIVVSRARPLAGLEKLWLYHIDGGTGIEMVSGAPGLRM